MGDSGKIQRTKSGLVDAGRFEFDKDGQRFVIGTLGSSSGDFPAL